VPDILDVLDKLHQIGTFKFSPRDIELPKFEVVVHEITDVFR
jgi:hypothetical protein